MRVVTPLLLLSLAVRPVAAQVSAADHIAMGDSAERALRPDEALRHYQAVVALDSTNYVALWKAARAIADVAKQVQGNADSLVRRRDSLYTVGRGYAEAAVRVDPNGADGHYAVAMALGRLSLTKGGKERVRFGKIIFDESSRAIALDSSHAGAHHVLGAWHANVRRLSGIQRFFAKALFGGGFLSRANWDAAVRHLERAVALEPQDVYHRLELARVYVDLERYTAAREMLSSIEPLPDGDVLDPEYKREAVELLNEIRNKRDETT